MVRVSRILKDYRETGALNSLIAVWGFVDDTTFLTKAGAVGLVYRLLRFYIASLPFGQLTLQCTKTRNCRIPLNQVE